MIDHIAHRARAKPARPVRPGPVDRLGTLDAFAPNPGVLAARIYVPADLRPGAALVVVLHGCTQTATGYDHGAGWSALADAHGFALLFPEQRRENNPNLCFNWFQPGDTRRGEGEVASIHAMIEAMLATQPIDPARVFVTGLSAGGAMAAALLAAYPDVFAGGAIVAGLPAGAAANVQQAMAAMQRGGAGAGSARIRAAVPAGCAWPRVSIWHGDADSTVVPANGEALVAQWCDVHGLGPARSRTERFGVHERRVWRGADGRDAVEHWKIAGLGHGTPIDADGAPGGGATGPYFLEAGLASTRWIARFFGLMPARSASVSAERPARAARVLTPEPLGRAMPRGVGKVIEDALRVAGLVK